MTMEQLAKQQRFLLEIEQNIIDTNQNTIHQRIPPLTPENLLPFVNSVARLRARYLEAAFKFAEKDCGDPLEEEEISDLRRQRQMYEEARDAFEALRHAIERGYVEISG
ncbi:MAG: hypothetical protein GKS00_09605 [Alphaproteobacteria bacterium]|nr:hypothetical protein [Alphaproteobacteria bacterium]